MRQNSFVLNSYTSLCLHVSDRSVLSALSFLLVLPVILKGLRIHTPHALRPLPVDHTVLPFTGDRRTEKLQLGSNVHWVRFELQRYIYFFLVFFKQTPKNGPSSISAQSPRLSTIEKFRIENVKKL